MTTADLNDISFGEDDEDVEEDAFQASISVPVASPRRTTSRIRNRNPSSDEEEPERRQRTATNLFAGGSLEEQIRRAIIVGVTEGVNTRHRQAEVSTRTAVEDEPDRVPILLDVPDHHIKDDGHDTIDFVARSVRPLQCEQDIWWKQQPRVARPVLEDLKMTHLTCSSISPKTIARVHDRGAELTLKMFLSSNVGVESRDGKLRFDTNSVQGAFLLDYHEPQGVWEAVGAVHNYITVLKGIRSEDYSGHVMLHTLHSVRFFAGACRNVTEQKKLVTNFCDQVFRKNACNGRNRTPPMDYKTCLELARQVMFEAGYDGTRSTIGVEPYSGIKTTTTMPSSTATSVSSNTKKFEQGNRPVKKNFATMTVKEKVDGCCRGFNSAVGCSRGSRCSYKHKCTHVDMTTNRVCWRTDHGLVGHK